MHTAVLLALLMGTMIQPVHGALDDGDGRPPRPRVLTDFEPGSLRWVTVLDGVMGGRSSGDFQLVGGRMDFRGVLNTNGGGFSSVRTGDQSMDLTGYRGLRLRVRADGRSYSLRVRQSGLRGGVSYRASFPTRPSAPGDAQEPGPWQTNFVPFTDLTPQWRGRKLDLPPLDPSKVIGLGITMSDGRDGPFRIELDEIAAYGPFALDEIRGERPALVVVGPSATHPAVLAWAKGLRAASSLAEEKGLLVIQVAGEGSSFAGERALSVDEARGVAAQLGLGPGDVGVRLVRVDGSRVFLPAERVEVPSILERLPARGGPGQRAEPPAGG